MSRDDRASEREFFRRIADGRLTPGEFAEFEQRLLSDSELRKRYVRAMNLEANLYESFNGPVDESSLHAHPRGPGRPLWMTMSVVGAVLTTAAVLFVGFLWRPQSAPVPPESAPVQTGMVAAPFRKPEPVAVVTQVRGIDVPASTGLRPGTSVEPGILKIPQGEVQIEFLNGAQLNLAGPAELHIFSVEAATLVAGRAAVRIPKGARGFILNTPDAAIIDLGTEFTASVGESGTSEVHVVDGEVEVSLLGDDGNTLTSRRLLENKSLRVRHEPIGLEDIAPPSSSLPAIHEQKSSPLVATGKYVDAVRAAQPLIYWRFENLVDGRVPNEVGPQWSAVIHADPDDESGIVIRDGVARFTPTPTQIHRIEADQPIAGLNREDFTIEFWATVDYFHWATFVAVIPDEDREIDRHLNLIEFPYQSALIYSPGSFRFLHRDPPGENGGINLFSNGGCTPGFWHHIAVVKTLTELKLYLDGRLVRRLAETFEPDDSAYRFNVGSLDTNRVDRALAGAIDELAVYLHALSDDEILAHYRAQRATDERP